MRMPGLNSAALSSEGITAGHSSSASGQYEPNIVDTVDFIIQGRDASKRRNWEPDIESPAASATDTSLLLAPSITTSHASSSSSTALAGISSSRITGLFGSTSPTASITSTSAVDDAPVGGATGDGGMSIGAAAGIGIGTTVGGVFVLLALGLIMHRRRKTVKTAHRDGCDHRGKSAASSHPMEVEGPGPGGDPMSA